MRDYFSTPAPQRREETLAPPRDRRPDSANPVWQRLALNGSVSEERSSGALEREAEASGHSLAGRPEFTAALARSGSPSTDHGMLSRDAVAVAAEHLGVPLSDVHLHGGAHGVATAQAAGADAVAAGDHIAVDTSKFPLDTERGRNLIAHEMVHVAQQSRGESAGPQHRPSELIDNFVFLGNTVGGGINPTLRDRLVAVEAHLKGIYDALGPDHADRTHPGGDPKSLRDWSGINSIRGWRPDKKGINATSKHASGSAVDVNYDLQPYIATRTGEGDKTIYGGEVAGASLQAERKAATDVYDRAMAFVHGTGRTADVSARKPGESAASAYTRFSTVDSALSYYLRHAMLEDPTSVKRRPVANVEQASESDLLQAIPTTERRPEAEAIADLEALMGNTFSAGQEFQKSHPGWPYSPRQQYFRMLRDYEQVRVPMQRNDPSASPPDTRNPTRGFLHMRREFVEAMMNVGKLRWGAVDLGAHTSGDVHHFDLGGHGGVVPDGTP